MFWIVLVACLIASTLLLYLFLQQQQTLQRAAFEMEDRMAEHRKLIIPLEKEPQSGMMIKCHTHGDVPITKSEYDKQTKQSTFRCPLCGHIPKKIWKKIPAVVVNL
jgi:hypothetical protein